MSWFSLLPEHLSVFEVWAVRFFLFLGFVTIGPWLILLVYDFVLYIWRTVTYEVPVLGGKARGKRRPRAPSLTERPSGRPRRFSSLAVPSVPASTAHSSPEAASLATGGSKSTANHRRDAAVDDD